MFQRIIVPVDGSHRSWDAARLGAVIARTGAASLELVHVVFDRRQIDHGRRELRSGLLAQRALAVEPDLRALVGDDDDSVAAVIARHAEATAGSMVVMSSSGRGRTAAVLGSVADDLVREMFGPIIVVGPNVTDLVTFDGDIIVPVDGSAFSETSLPLAAAWGIGLGATPWIVEVLDRAAEPGGDVAESSYPKRLAAELGERSHHAVEFDVLHGTDPGRAIAGYADAQGAGLVLMSTHGRSGLRRLTLGSTAATVVHHASCPVVLHRPPRLDLDSDLDGADSLVRGSASHAPGR